MSKQNNIAGFLGKCHSISLSWESFSCGISLLDFLLVKHPIYPPTRWPERNTRTIQELLG